MRFEEYQNIIKDIRNFRGVSKDCAKMLIEKYNSIPKNTLYSILSSEIQQRMKVTHGRLFGGEKDYYKRYKKSIQTGESTGILVRMAEKINSPPVLLARYILEKYMVASGQNFSRPTLSKLLKDTTLITDKELAYETFLCVLNDDQYGPISDAIALSVGQEYEVKLQNYLKERHIAFRNEDQLRTRGYDKTPDIKLEVPVAVNGCVINWIESKARFGNDEIHKRYIKDQFLSYWNRFGPGLVIYWFGFLDPLSQPSERRFIIMDSFPAEITYMSPNSIKHIPF